MTLRGLPEHLLSGAVCPSESVPVVRWLQHGYSRGLCRPVSQQKPLLPQKVTGWGANAVASAVLNAGVCGGARQGSWPSCGLGGFSADTSG